VTDQAQPAASGRAVDIGAYRAWLFDLDGVLTKTAEVHAAAWKTTFDAFLAEEATRIGCTFDPFDPFDPVADYERYVDGEPREDGVRNFLAARGITLPEGSDADLPQARTVRAVGGRKNAQVQALLKSTGVAVYEGAIDFVTMLRGRGILTAVVSASENTAAALDAAGIAGLFQVRIDGQVVKERHLAGKPAPDSYLEAAKALGVTPGDAVVVEDALAGVEAGRGGHFGLVVGIDHHDHADQLRSHGADVVVADLAELLDKTVTQD